jgi:hypothetical protein
MIRPRNLKPGTVRFCGSLLPLFIASSLARRLREFFPRLLARELDGEWPTVRSLLAACHHVPKMAAERRDCWACCTVTEKGGMTNPTKKLDEKVDFEE